MCGNGKDDNCDGVQDEGCAPQSPVECNVDGLKCGGGIGTCAKGHCRYTDRHGYAWTLVPAGKFWMGCNPAVDEVCAMQANENPQHEVEVSAFWIGVYEVTAGIYKSCAESPILGCTAPATVGGTSLSTFETAGKELHPVNYVTWAQSLAVCSYGQSPTRCK